MMRSVFIASIAVILSVCLPAGNRADVNADQAVNAADSAVLANILSGNLDLAGYDLANVVVVAPQGGDFTDPRTRCSGWPASLPPPPTASSSWWRRASTPSPPA